MHQAQKEQLQTAYMNQCRRRALMLSSATTPAPLSEQSGSDHSKPRSTSFDDCTFAVIPQKLHITTNNFECNSDTGASFGSHGKSALQETDRSVMRRRRAWTADAVWFTQAAARFSTADPHSKVRHTTSSSGPLPTAYCPHNVVCTDCISRLLIQAMSPIHTLNAARRLIHDCAAIQVTQLGRQASNPPMCRLNRHCVGKHTPGFITTQVGALWAARGQLLSGPKCLQGCFLYIPQAGLQAGNHSVQILVISRHSTVCLTFQVLFETRTSSAHR